MALNRNLTNLPTLTVLSNGVSAGTTVLTVASAANLPAVDTAIAIDDEVLLVTAKAGNDLTVTRGYGGTVAAAHEAGADVRQVLIKEDIEDLDARIAPLEARPTPHWWQIGNFGTLGTHCATAMPTGKIADTTTAQMGPEGQKLMAFGLIPGFDFTPISFHIEHGSNGSSTGPATGIFGVYEVDENNAPTGTPLFEETWDLTTGAGYKEITITGAPELKSGTLYMGVMGAIESGIYRLIRMGFPEGGWGVGIGHDFAAQSRYCRFYKGGWTDLANGLPDLTGEDFSTWTTSTLMPIVIFGV